MNEAQHNGQHGRITPYHPIWNDQGLQKKKENKNVAITFTRADGPEYSADANDLFGLPTLTSIFLLLVSLAKKKKKIGEKLGFFWVWVSNVYDLGRNRKIAGGHLLFSFLGRKLHKKTYQTRMFSPLPPFALVEFVRSPPCIVLIYETTVTGRKFATCISISLAAIDIDWITLFFQLNFVPLFRSSTTKQLD